MPTTRPRLKRIMQWLAVAVLLVGGYFASGPIVLSTLNNMGMLDRFPILWDVVVTVYAPGGYWYDHAEVPGHDAYFSYCNWVANTTTTFWQRM